MEKNAEPGNVATNTKSAPQCEALLIRKRMTWTPAEGAQLRRIGLGYFVRELKEPSDVIRAMQEANLPGARQLSLSGKKLVIRKRAFKRNSGAKKVGKYQELEAEIADIKEMISVLRRVGFLNGQVIYLASATQAEKAMKADRAKIEERRKAKGRKH